MWGLGLKTLYACMDVDNSLVVCGLYVSVRGNDTYNSVTPKVFLTSCIYIYM